MTHKAPLPGSGAVTGQVADPMAPLRQQFADLLRDGDPRVRDARARHAFAMQGLPAWVAAHGDTGLIALACDVALCIEDVQARDRACQAVLTDRAIGAVSGSGNGAALVRVLRAVGALHVDRQQAAAGRLLTPAAVACLTAAEPHCIAALNAAGKLPAVDARRFVLATLAQAVAGTGHPGLVARFGLAAMVLNYEDGGTVLRHLLTPEAMRGVAARGTREDIGAVAELVLQSSGAERSGAMDALFEHERTTGVLLATDAGPEANGLLQAALVAMSPARRAQVLARCARPDWRDFVDRVSPPPFQGGAGGPAP